MGQWRGGWRRNAPFDGCDIVRSFQKKFLIADHLNNLLAPWTGTSNQELHLARIVAIIWQRGVTLLARE